MSRIYIWVIQIALEILLGACILNAALGSNNNPSFPGFTGDLIINSMYVALFMVLSGYLVTTYYVVVLMRDVRVVNENLLKVGLFVTHTCAFLVITGMWSTPGRNAILIGGLLVVLLSSQLLWFREKRETRI